MRAKRERESGRKLGFVAVFINAINVVVPVVAIVITPVLVRRLQTVTHFPPELFCLCCYVRMYECMNV